MIDLHMHSKASDGSDDIEVLLEKLKREGITTFSVTDHDTAEGALRMEELCRNVPDLCYFRGIEFSCISPVAECHILGYGYDPDHEAFRAVIAEGEQLRSRKLKRRLQFLKEEHGIVFAPETVQQLQTIKSVGKPHLAKELIRLGYASTVTEAIKTWLAGCDRGVEDRVPAERAIRAILASGGIPVWAHPLGGEGEKRLDPDSLHRQLQYLTDHGIQGLECYYSRYTIAEHDLLLELARQKHLLISAGSDYHGTAKTIALGELCAEPFAMKEEYLTLPQALAERMR